MLSFLKKSHLQFPVNVFWEYSLFHSSFKCLWSYCLCRTCPSSGIGSETTPYVQWNKDILHECLFKNFYLVMHLLQFPTSVDVFSVCCYYLKALVYLKPFARQYHTVIYLKKKKRIKKDDIPVGYCGCHSGTTAAGLLSSAVTLQDFQDFFFASVLITKNISSMRQRTSCQHAI